MLAALRSLDLQSLSAAVDAGQTTPSDIVDAIDRRIDARGDDKVWIHRVPRAALDARANELERLRPRDLPLYGIPFAVKDNIDVAGLPTTAGCPAFAYIARETAPVVQRLIAAGAILVGKTNLDQFATGLVGTRSPYGACANAFDAAYISGGSSSGSAVAVASGLVSFALGTDTAGSGRVPAAFNNIVGLKPTRGVLSARGVVPACRTLDCVSIFSLTTGDAARVFDIAASFDAEDAFARREEPSALASSFAGLRIGVPKNDQLEFFGNAAASALFAHAVEKLVALGARRIEIDFTPFLAAARLLYEGPWVAERYVAIRDFIEKKPEALLPVTREIISSATRHSAADGFAAQYRLMALRRESEQAWNDIDIVVTPTAGTIYTIAQVNAEPIRLNSNLGYYTNFMNLFDLAAIAVPAGLLDTGLPFGITLFAPAHTDRSLCALGDAAHRTLGNTLGATGQPLPPAAKIAGLRTPATVRVAVCGAHMSGLPLNHQLTERGGRLVRTSHTARAYRLFALEGFKPPRPGLVRVEPGTAIDVEVWEVPSANFGSFVDSIPGPLGIGTLELEDGEKLRGFLCESYATAGAPDISHLGSWRAYVKT
ncbi:MAG: allophanate hydrolase [Burkholderiales bacterium]